MMELNKTKLLHKFLLIPRFIKYHFMSPWSFQPLVFICFLKGLTLPILFLHTQSKQKNLNETHLAILNTGFYS